VRHHVEVFEGADCDAVVAPSGSCVGSVRHPHAKKLCKVVNKRCRVSPSVTSSAPADLWVSWTSHAIATRFCLTERFISYAGCQPTQPWTGAAASRTSWTAGCDSQPDRLARAIRWPPCGFDVPRSTHWPATDDAPKCPPLASLRGCGGWTTDPR
jgi:hypothetical protein